jgi:hypothetical protein
MDVRVNGKVERRKIASYDPQLHHRLGAPRPEFSISNPVPVLKKDELVAFPLAGLPEIVKVRASGRSYE